MTGGMQMLRLRQIALVASELRSAELEICERLGLEVCYRDPGLARFGLRHGLYAIGDQLLEVVAPKAPGTTAGRFIDRRGEGGYMVLVQTNALAEHKARVEDAGLRVVHDGRVELGGESIRGIHLHPKDVGGAILSIDQAEPPESWLWAGADWRYHSLADVVTAITAIDLQADDPQALAQRWSRAIDRPVRDGVIELDDAELRFVQATDGRGDGLSAAELRAADRTRAGECLELCGFQFRLV
ncbi:MAG: VOC family protein [Pseudomonadota bacterium]|nr:VOC family protein [Pseudomonadota bacterium]